MQVAEALALEVPPLPVAAIYRRICQIAKDTGNSAPSYDVIYEVRVGTQGASRDRSNIGRGELFSTTLLSFVLYSLLHSHEIPARQG